MNVRSIMFVVAALVAVGGTVFFVQRWMESQRTKPVTVAKATEAPKTYVLVAKVNLPTGAFLNPKKHFAWQAWPDANVHPTYIRRKTFVAQGITGAVVRRGISAGEPITPARIVKPGERGFMAAVLTPGMRAITISVNAGDGGRRLRLPGRPGRHPADPSIAQWPASRAPGE